MPRIRSLKPDLWEDEALGSCSPLAMLVFVFLITQADDEGRLRAHPALLRNRLFPYRPEVTAKQVEAALVELSNAGIVRSYLVNGERFLSLPSWHRHQRIDKPSKSQIPPPPPDSESPRETSTKPREDSATEGKGEERKGEEPNGSGASDFDTFWKCYPRKVAKPAAEKAWRQTEKDRPALPQLLAALRASIDAARRKGPNWLDYFKHPATWLRAHSWNDEVLTERMGYTGTVIVPVPSILAGTPEVTPEPEPEVGPIETEAIERESWVDTFRSHGLPLVADEAEWCTRERLLELQAIHAPAIERKRAEALAKIRAGRLVA